MTRPLAQKSTIEQIRQRFDVDVERFSKLETGQQAAMDAPLILDLVSRAAGCRLQPGGKLLDLGCGAGNFTLSVLLRVAPLDCVLVDLSRPMLDRAEQRLKAAGADMVQTVQSDLRELRFAAGSFDAILAGQVLHHLRDDADWEHVFARLHEWLKPGGTLFVADFVAFDDPGIQNFMTERYSGYLQRLGGPEYRDKVLAYCDAEDSPRSIRFQFDLLRRTGFLEMDVLHRNTLFAAYYATKR